MFGLESVITTLAPSLIKTIGAAFGINTESDEVKAKTMEAELALLTAVKNYEEKQLDLQRLQVEVNLAEAGNQSLFVSGWRPSVGWICALIFAYHGLILPFLLFLTGLFHWTVPLPQFDISMFTTVLMGMLGLAGMRSFDKWQNSALGVKKVGDSKVYPKGTNIQDIIDGKI